MPSGGPIQALLSVDDVVDPKALGLRVNLSPVTDEDSSSKRPGTDRMAGGIVVYR